MRFNGLFKNNLAREVRHWVDDGLVSVEQAEQIGHRYDIDIHQPVAHSFGYRVLMTLGFLFIGLALIVLIGANWDDIPRFARMAALIGLTMATHVLAIYKYAKGAVGQGVGLIFLGNLFYGASIILIAQIYHLGEHMPDGVFWWTLGSLPFALILGSGWLMLQTLLLAILWFLMELMFSIQLLWFALFLVAALIVLVRGQPNRLLAIVTFLAAVVWLNLALVDLNEFGINNVVVTTMVCLVTVVAGVVWQDQNTIFYRYRSTLNHLIIFATVGFLLLFSYQFPWKSLLRTEIQQPLLVLAVITAICFMCLMAITVKRRFNPLLWVISFTYFSLAALLVLGGGLDVHALIGIDLLPEVTGFNPSLANVFKVVCGVALFLAGTLLVVNGVNQSVALRFYLGVICILASAWARYFDLAGSYISGAILFVVCAVVLLAAAKYWSIKNRLSTSGISSIQEVTR